MNSTTVIEFFTALITCFGGGFVVGSIFAVVQNLLRSLSGV